MNDVSPGKLVLIIGAGVTFVFSFLPWFSFNDHFTSSQNAWGSGLFPMASWAPVLALVAGFLVAAEAFEFVNLPEKIASFTLDQVVLVCSAVACLITISYIIVDKSPAGIGPGLWLCFLGTIALLSGYFMDKTGVGVNPQQRSDRPAPPPGEDAPGESPPPQQPGPS